jgi:hypothetical protein
LVGDASNPRYGAGKVYRNKDSGLFIIEKDILLPEKDDSTKEIEKWNACFDIFEEVEHKNIVLFFGKRDLEQPNKSKKMTCYFEYLPKNLLK